MASPPRLLAQRPAPTSPFLRSCSAHSAHWNRDEGLGLPFRPWGWVGSWARNSANAVGVLAGRGPVAIDLYDLRLDLCPGMEVP